MLTLDHATKGRTFTVLATGENKQQKPYGVSRKGAGDKLWDTVQIVRRFLDSNDPVSFTGRVYNVDRGLIGIPPYGDRPPRFYVAGGTPEVRYLAGTFADGWVTYMPS